MIQDTEYTEYIPCLCLLPLMSLQLEFGARLEDLVELKDLAGVDADLVSILQQVSLSLRLRTDFPTVD